MQTIYDLLTNSKISELTIENLDAATERTFVEKDGMDFWQGILVLSHVLNASRTYAHGLPIPESGAVHIETIADSADATIKPTGTEVWRVENIDLDNCTVEFQDGDGNLSPVTFQFGGQYQAPFFTLPFHISSTLFLKFTNGSGGSQTPSIAYHKVSL